MSATPAAIVRSRIVGSGTADPAALTANPANWRTHPPDQVAALGGVLDRVGWVQTVIVNKTTGRLVDGHLRVRLAVDRGERSIPVTYVELSEAEEGLVLAMLDPIAAMAGVEDGLLSSLLGGLDDDARMLAELAHPPVEQSFPRYDEDAADKVVMHECPSCHHRWPA